MPHDIRVIAARDFLRADVHGNVDLAASKRIFAELAQACAGHPDRHILIDVRGAGVPMLSSVDLFELVQTLQQFGLGVLNRIAILRRHPDKFDRARFFEIIANDRGFNVGAFEDFEKAFDWLHVGGDLL